MSVGKAILRIRLEKGLTQKEVGRRSQLATSYLSRIENGHIQPTVKTLSRVMEALGSDASEVFALSGDPLADAPHRCPVSSSGSCVGEMIRSHAGAPPKGSDDKVSYGPLELKMLRMADYVILHGSDDVRSSLRVILETFVSQASKNG